MPKSSIPDTQLHGGLNHRCRFGKFHTRVHEKERAGDSAQNAAGPKLLPGYRGGFRLMVVELSRGDLCHGTHGSVLLLIQ